MENILMVKGMDMEKCSIMIEMYQSKDFGIMDFSNKKLTLLIYSNMNELT